MTSCRSKGTVSAVSSLSIVSRRTFLGGAAGAAAIGAGTWAWLQAQGYAVDPPSEPLERIPPALPGKLPGPPFDPRARTTLAALYGHLFPGDAERGLPNAGAAKVFEYVESASRHPGLRPVRDDILKLARFLDREAAPARFSDLPLERATRLLQAVGENRRPKGRFVPARALETALRLGLEGYLGHPHHGGNPDFITWEALDIRMPRARYPLAGGHSG